MGVMKSLLSPRQAGIRGAGSLHRDSDFITGDKELMALMEKLRTTAARRVMTAGTAEAAKLLAKEAKSEIPSRMKGARAALGWRRLKAKEAPGGGAKVGAKVGRTRKKALREKEQDRTGKKGVGISAQNIHWLIFGTDERYTGKNGGAVRYTGAMPPQIHPMRVIAARNAAAMRMKIHAGAAKQLKKEVAKGKAF